MGRTGRWWCYGLAAFVVGTTAVFVVSAAASGKRTPRLGTYLQGPFTQKTVNRFVRDLATVGVGVYATGANTPLRPVRSPVSPMRLTSTQARAAALGIWSHAGLTGAKLDALAPRQRLTAKVSIGLGTVVAGWAKRAQTPTAKLARRILGSPNWKQYRRIVFPNAVLVLFASDFAVHVAPRMRQRLPSEATISRAGPCTAVQTFIDSTIDAVFRAIGRISTDQATIDRLFGTGFLGRVVRGIGDVLSLAVNTAVNAAHQIVLGGVRLATGVVTNAIAATAGAIAVISQIASALTPWTGKVDAAPNPTSKGIRNGVPGRFSLTVTAPGSNLQWPPFVEDCAHAFGIALPSLIPSNADVAWDVSSQNPGELIVRKGDTGPLDSHGKAELRFETTTESPQLVRTGKVQTGAVVAVAKIHRKDIDQLADRVSRNIVAQLPAIMQTTIGPLLQAQLTPLIDAVTAKIAAVRDLQTTGIEQVRYHVPAQRKPPAKPGRKPKPGGGGAIFRVVVRWPVAGAPRPLLVACTHSGLRGPWRGKFDFQPPAPTRKLIPVSFSLDSHFNGSFAGHSTAVRPDEPNGSIEATNLWRVHVHVAASAEHPTMSFPGSQQRGIQIQHPSEVVIDTGWIPFTALIGRSFAIAPRSSC